MIDPVLIENNQEQIDSIYEFYKNVTPMYEKMFVLNNEIEYLEQLRDTLLPKLINGEIELENIEI